ncbi:hypothetical protein QQZ08_001533 [Neonectria magnoliae]|uniref:Uncharacterized protein n=1 Tax=Neonectria magnoliae TaxID=2732573 RepID=A0ABR1IFZ0_9HYPO
MSNYIVTEPAPSSTTYMRSGRGGAGNVVHVANAKASSSHAVPTVTPTRRFFSGIGGAGNAHAAGERPALSLDEEYDRAAARDQAAMGHCGIGGAGNVYRRKASDASSEASTSSSLSGKNKLWARVSGTFNRDQ